MVSGYARAGCHGLGLGLEDLREKLCRSVAEVHSLRGMVGQLQTRIVQLESRVECAMSAGYMGRLRQERRIAALEDAFDSMQVESGERSSGQLRDVAEASLGGENEVPVPPVPSSSGVPEGDRRPLAEVEAELRDREARLHCEHAGVYAKVPPPSPPWLSGVVAHCASPIAACTSPPAEAPPAGAQCVASPTIGDQEE